MAESLLDMFRGNVRERGARPALVFLADGENVSQILTFEALARVAEAQARRLLEHARVGDRVLLLLEPGPDYVASFLACLWAGLVAVPAYPPRKNARSDRVERIAANARPRLALTDDPATAERLGRTLPVLAGAPAPSDQEPRPLEPYRPAAEEVAFLQYTSGSTADPRGVRITHGNLLHNERTIRAAFRPDPDEVSVTWLPPYHDMGLIGTMLQPLAVGMTTIVLTPTAFLQRPVRWLRAISEHRATYSGGPDFAYALAARSATPDDLRGLDLSSWRVAYQGAERVRPETLAAFSKRFEACGFRRAAFAPCFGLAEATLMVTAVGRGEQPSEVTVDAKELELGRLRATTADDASVRRFVRCGAPRGSEVRIVDPTTGAPAGEQEVGEIWVSGPSVAGGYFEAEDETERTFRARLPGSDAEWLRTGDLGCFVDGELVVTGRLKDIIIVDGKNHAPEDLEATASRCHPAFVPHGCAVFSFEHEGKERVVVAQEIRRDKLRTFDAGPALLEVRRAVSDEHGIAPFDVAFLRPHGLPRTSSGKLRRGAARIAYRAGELARIEVASSVTKPATAGREQLLELLTTMLAEELEQPAAAIDPTLPLGSLGLDSVTAVVLAGKLSRALGREISPTLAYDYPTIERMAAYLASPVDPTRERVAPASPMNAAAPSGAIAVVGIGCRFPGAADPAEFLELLRAGRNAVRDRRPATRPDAELPGFGGFLDDPSRFDAAHFGIFPREAERIDPQQRLVLEVSWEALEHAAIAPDSLGGRAVGVFVGISGFDYSRHREPHPTAGTGNALSIAANRVSYTLDLRGPSLSVDTACSSSLVAVHLACQALQRGECELALAGGVNLLLDDAPSEVLRAAGMLSPDGRCATFDQSANGYVRGEGAGILVLKPLDRALESGDEVLAVIRGTAVNQDGRTSGLTAPNGPSQREVIAEAWRRAGVTAREIGLIEAHGTGTPLGDPIEVNVLAALCAERAPARCFVGSVKSNVGHLEAAAGVAGLIKLILSVKTGTIFPTLHFTRRNPAIELGPALAIAEVTAHWDEARRVAGVSSFGFGGTNAHVVVESAPMRPRAVVAPGPSLATLSARRREQLPELARRLESWVESRPEASLENLCAGMNLGRAHGPHRAAIVVDTRDELLEWLRAEAAVRPTTASRRAGSSNARRTTLEEAARAFVLGSRVDLSLLHAGVERAGGLPPTPFERTRYWVAPVKERQTARRTRTAHHPLLGRPVVIDDRPGALFQSTVSLSTDQELLEHRAFQSVVVAGACQVSLLVDAHRLAFGDGPLAIKNLSFPQGLILEEGDTRVLQLELDEAVNGSSSFRWRSRSEGANAAARASVVHAVGSFGALVPEADVGEDFERLRARCPKHLDHDAFYALAEGHGLQFGESYRFNDEVWVGKSEAVARMRWPVPAEVAGEYALPPGLVDSCFQLAAATGFERGDEAFILFRIREYAFYRPVKHGEALWAHAARHTDSPQANVQKFSVRLFDENGRLVSEARDVELHRASIQGFLRSLRRDWLDGLFYGVDWEAWSPAACEELPKRFVVFGGHEGFDAALHERLSSRGVEVAFIRPGWEQALEAMLPEGRFAIVYAWPLLPDQPPVTGADALALQTRGSVGLLSVLRSVMKLGRAGDLVLRVAAQDTAPEAPDTTDAALPVHAPLRGLLKAYAAEHPGVDVRLVDACRDAEVEAVVDALLAAGPESEVAVRKGATYVPRLVRTAEQTVTDTQRLDPEASYVVTGGTGGLGLRSARWLLSRGARHLALLARREPDEAGRAAVRALSSLGAEVVVLQADVADEAEVERAFASIPRPVRGVIHAAGVLDDGRLDDQTPERFLSVLAPKLAGAMSLARATRAQPLDFLLFYSSVASLLGSPGQSSYAAGNAFLDAFAVQRGRGTTSVWWGPWAEVGMAARQSERARGALSAAGFEPLRPAVAVELHEQILRSSRRQVAVLSLDWARYFAARRATFPLLDRLRAELDGASVPSRLRHELIARLRASDAGTAVELLTEHLSRQVAEVAEVPVESIDRHRRLSELGLDSLMALNLQTLLEEELGVSVPITRFMEDVSLRGLAEELRPSLGSAAKPEDPAPAAEPEAAPLVSHAETVRPPVARSLGRSSELRLAPRVQAGLDISLFYFSRSAEGSGSGYRLLVDGARFADENGLCAVWLPERHFHEFGGLYPNPSVLASHLAAVTSRVRLRAGSVVLPLHHPLRVAEEWAVVDNLSSGRVDLSFVRGWGPNDFALAPGEFERRGESLLEKLDQVRRLWRGEAIELLNGQGKPTMIRSFPRPQQPELPVWLTCTREEARFVEAGRLGVNVLTALLLQSPEELERNLRAYRSARAEHGHDPSSGHVTLMLHTFVGKNERDVLECVRAPLTDYLKSSLELWSTGSSSLDSLGERERARVLDYALERYTKTSSLIGTPEHCLSTLRRFRDRGVNEVACLIDFGVSDEEALEALEHLPLLGTRMLEPPLVATAP